MKHIKKFEAVNPITGYLDGESSDNLIEDIKELFLEYAEEFRLERLDDSFTIEDERPPRYWYVQEVKTDVCAIYIWIKNIKELLSEFKEKYFISKMKEFADRLEHIGYEVNLSDFYINHDPGNKNLNRRIFMIEINHSDVTGIEKRSSFRLRNQQGDHAKKPTRRPA